MNRFDVVTTYFVPSAINKDIGYEIKIRDVPVPYYLIKNEG